jgi:hypothetical protein
MARSTKIYVVGRIPYASPVAAFTVKHEMIDWLKKHKGDKYFGLWIVSSVNDGANQEKNKSKFLGNAEELIEGIDTDRSRR